MTVRLGLTGALLALLYGVVALGTSAISSRPVRPLFDGFAPPVAYNWVSPPPERAGDNTVPKPVERELPLGPEGTEAVIASTDDNQAAVGLDKGSVPAHPPDDAVRVRLVPLDSATLGPLPAGLRPVSNAYQVTISYVSSQIEIPQLAKKGTISLTNAERGEKLLHSLDGRQWQERSAQSFGQDNGLFAELETPGYFVIASALHPTPEHAIDGPGARNTLLALAAIVPIAGAVLVLLLPSPVPTRAAATGRSSPRRGTRKKGGSARRSTNKRRRR